MDDVDVAVIGGGVIGLAIARALSLRGREVWLFEAEKALGTHTSSRNSEVIHAGIYYPKDSLKAQLCVRGKQLLYEFCVDAEVAHRRTGKLIVATTEQEISELARIKERAEGNGVTDLTWVNQADLNRLEPAVQAVRGLYSPSTGIIDSHGLMMALKRDAVENGAEVILNSPVAGGSVGMDGMILRVGGPEPMEIRCRSVINAAGLLAPQVAARMEGLGAEHVPESYFARGHYFVLGGKAPFRHLVYPVPEPGGLGVHVTLDLAGQARFGPDVQYLPSVSYDFDESRKAAFVQAIRRYYPDLDSNALEPGYTGVRPKLTPLGAPAADFRIDGAERHGVRGLINLFGIESPGLTASLALAELGLFQVDGLTLRYSVPRKVDAPPVRRPAVPWARGRNMMPG